MCRIVVAYTSSIEPLLAAQQIQSEFGTRNTLTSWQRASKPTRTPRAPKASPTWGRSGVALGDAGRQHRWAQGAPARSVSPQVVAGGHTKPLAQQFRLPCAVVAECTVLRRVRRGPRVRAWAILGRGQSVGVGMCCVPSLSVRSRW